MQTLQRRCFWGGLVFLVFGIFLVFVGQGYPYGLIFLLAGLALGALWYFLWSRDMRAIRRNQERQQQPPMVQKQRSVPMSDERSKRITPPGEL